MSKALVIRTCNADLTSHNGFKWPASGPVEVGYVGRRGIKADTPYRLTAEGQWEEVVA